MTFAQRSVKGLINLVGWSSFIKAETSKRFMIFYALCKLGNSNDKIKAKREADKNEKGINCSLRDELRDMQRLFTTSQPMPWLL
jgi:hypothetical protein